jgi:predicted NBD/HSP70 family sugar kinase
MQLLTFDAVSATGGNIGAALPQRNHMADQTLAKYLNELRILTMLRMQGPASRADIARRLALTPATITRLISNLAQQELVSEVRDGISNPAAREPGRPGVRVAICPNGAYFLGAEIGVGILRFSLIDLTATVVHSSEILVAKTISPVEAVKAIVDHLTMLEHDIRFHKRIRGAGVTVPGLVTSEGFILNLPILGWRNVNLREMLGSSLNLPCFVENNANAAAFGSVYTQPSLPSICTIFLKLGTGCGGAAIVNGRLLRGANGTAGEFGHLRITEHGPHCSCGQDGCLESWVNLGALARAYHGRDDLQDPEYAALPAAVVAAAENGDAAAGAAMDHIAHYLGLGIVSLVNIFNPTTIMLGGVMRPVLEKRLEAIQSRVAEMIVPGTTVPDVRLSLLGTFECATGVATIAHHHAFDISTVELSEPALKP